MNNDFTLFFMMIALINFDIGLSNANKNDDINNKLDKMLELLDGRE